MEDRSTQVIAIDGAAATGKSTLAQLLAADLGFIYMDTGLMFRALTYEALQRNMVHSESIQEQALRSFLKDSQFNWLNNQLALNGQVYGDEIRTLAVSQQVSRIAALKVVRDFTLANQRRLSQGNHIVMDGRDIGTVVFPNAQHKFFLEASAEVRAHRRWKELEQKRESTTFDSVLQNVMERDKLDSERAHAPLRKAKDAVCIDTSNKSIATILAEMKSLIV